MEYKIGDLIVFNNKVGKIQRAFSSTAFIVLFDYDKHVVFNHEIRPYINKHKIIEDVLDEI